MSDISVLLIEKRGRYAYRRAAWLAQLERIRALPEFVR